MQIRTILLSLSILGTVLTAAVVWLLLTEQEGVIAQSEIDLKYKTYSDTWSRIAAGEKNLERLELRGRCFFPRILTRSIINREFGGRLSH